MPKGHSSLIKLTFDNSDFPPVVYGANNELDFLPSLKVWRALPIARNMSLHDGDEDARRIGKCQLVLSRFRLLLNRDERLSHLPQLTTGEARQKQRDQYRNTECPKGIILAAIFFALAGLLLGLVTSKIVSKRL